MKFLSALSLVVFAASVVAKPISGPKFNTSDANYSLWIWHLPNGTSEQEINATYIKENGKPWKEPRFRWMWKKGPLHGINGTKVSWIKNENGTETVWTIREFNATHPPGLEKRFKASDLTKITWMIYGDSYKRSQIQNSTEEQNSTHSPSSALAAAKHDSTRPLSLWKRFKASDLTKITWMIYGDSYKKKRGLEERHLWEMNKTHMEGIKNLMYRHQYWWICRNKGWTGHEAHMAAAHLKVGGPGCPTSFSPRLRVRISEYRHARPTVSPYHLKGVNLHLPTTETHLSTDLSTTSKAHLSTHHPTLRPTLHAHPISTHSSAHLPRVTSHTSSSTFKPSRTQDLKVRRGIRKDKEQKEREREWEFAREKEIQRKQQLQREKMEKNALGYNATHKKTTYWNPRWGHGPVVTNEKDRVARPAPKIQYKPNTPARLPAHEAFPYHHKDVKVDYSEDLDKLNVDEAKHSRRPPNRKEKKPYKYDEEGYYHPSHPVGVKPLSGKQANKVDDTERRRPPSRKEKKPHKYDSEAYYHPSHPQGIRPLPAEEADKVDDTEGVEKLPYDPYHHSEHYHQPDHPAQQYHHPAEHYHQPVQPAEYDHQPDHPEYFHEVSRREIIEPRKPRCRAKYRHHEEQKESLDAEPGQPRGDVYIDHTSCARRPLKVNVTFVDNEGRHAALTIDRHMRDSMQDGTHDLESRSVRVPDSDWQVRTSKLPCENSYIGWKEEHYGRMLAHWQGHSPVNYTYKNSTVYRDPKQADVWHVNHLWHGPAPANGSVGATNVTHHISQSWHGSIPSNYTYSHTTAHVDAQHTNHWHLKTHWHGPGCPSFNSTAKIHTSHPVDAHWRGPYSTKINPLGQTTHRPEHAKRFTDNPPIMEEYEYKNTEPRYRSVAQNETNHGTVFNTSASEKQVNKTAPPNMISHFPTEGVNISRSDNTSSPVRRAFKADLDGPHKVDVHGSHNCNPSDFNIYRVRDFGCNDKCFELDYSGWSIWMEGVFTQTPWAYMYKEAHCGGEPQRLSLGMRGSHKCHSNKDPQPWRSMRLFWGCPLG